MAFEPKYRNRFDFEGDFEIENLINDIEEMQAEQLKIIKDKENEIEHLTNENKKLNEMLASKISEIDYLNLEIKKLESIIVDNDQKHQMEMNEKISELYTIMEMTKKINEQNREIEKLEIETKKQEEAIESSETEDFNF